MGPEARNTAPTCSSGLSNCLLRRMSPLLALSGHPLVRCTCPLSGAKQTSVNGLAIVIRRALLNWLAISLHVPTKIQARQM
jgi:hypothetical protein